MRNLLNINAVLLGVLLSFNACSASAILRCKGNIVKKGDSVHRLLSKCGMPNYVNSYLNKYFMQVRQMYYTEVSNTFVYIVEVRESRVHNIRTERN